MLDRLKSRIVAIDGGTTNTRARLLDRGEIVATARRGVGVRDSVISGSAAHPLIQAIRECLDEVLEKSPGPIHRIVAAGMLSSEVGLAAVPHLIAPCGIAELAAGSVERLFLELHELPIFFIPGIKTPASNGPDGWADCDVMRGEEVETFGAMESIENLKFPCAFLWPGSHSKLVLIDENRRISRSFTTLAGELTATLASQTLIAKSLPMTLPDHPDPLAIESASRIVRRDGLGRAAFLVRIADLTGAMDEHQRASFWVGAVIAEDAAHLATHPILADPLPLWIGGRNPQRTLYAQSLGKLHAGPVHQIPEALAGDVSAIGALAILARLSG